MHVAIVRRRYSLRAGGAEKYCVNISRQLRALGNQVTVIGESIDDELKTEVDFIPVKVDHSSSWAKNSSFAENAAKQASRPRFDIRFGLSRAHCLDVFRLTDPLHSHWMKMYYRNSAHRLLQSVNPRHRTLLDLERSIYSQTRCIITQSQLDRQLINTYYGVPQRKVRTIYNGVNASVFHPRVRADSYHVRREFELGDSPLLVFVGMAFERKGLATVLEALRHSQHHNARLVVVGTGRVAKFQRLAKALDVHERVVFTGHQTNVARFYGAGDLFLQPTLYEPFPNVNIEAMACGLPVATTATSGSVDVVEHGKNGYLIPHGRAVDELTACLDQHLSLSPKARAVMSTKCQKTAQSMTVENNACQLLKVFEEVLVEKNRA